MVSYYNHFAMYPKNHGGNLPYSTASGWYTGNYQHQPPHPQFIGDGESSPQPMFYTHPHAFHQASPDWSGHESFPTPPQTTLIPHGPSPGGLHLGSQGSVASNTNHNHGGDHIGEGPHCMPSPPITVSGSDMSSPGAPNGLSSPQITSRPTPVKSPYEWIKKQSYQTQPNPGKTRTKDKYRVVYTDQQRFELEKEFHYTRYITIRRKSELAQTLQLSERQVKIWFQNRRAKDRKQKKKAENGPVSLSGQQLMVAHSQHNGSQSMSSLLMDTKPKLEPGLHLSHLHQMSAMSMGMGSMGLHPAHHPLHPHLGVPTSQHLNQTHGSQGPPASLSVM
ncbi:homeotic protein caudal [Wyeomyia smithii]|uniref:homeotic protein caudal n=1 Tax=Wyeomyia smithii TaxID=174621 RepID=UPI002467AE52|nr:homeotic protein caudal [Wyeomyia smithii]